MPPKKVSDMQRVWDLLYKAMIMLMEAQMAITEAETGQTAGQRWRSRSPRGRRASSHEPATGASGSNNPLGSMHSHVPATPRFDPPVQPRPSQRRGSQLNSQPRESQPAVPFRPMAHAPPPLPPAYPPPVVALQPPAGNRQPEPDADNEDVLFNPYADSV